jgi:hypothetical protein
MLQELYINFLKAKKRGVGLWSKKKNPAKVLFTLGPPPHSSRLLISRVPMGQDQRGRSRQHAGLSGTEMWPVQEGRPLGVNTQSWPPSQSTAALHIHSTLSSHFTERHVPLTPPASTQSPTQETLDSHLQPRKTPSPVMNHHPRLYICQQRDVCTLLASAYGKIQLHLS